VIEGKSMYPDASSNIGVKNSCGQLIYHSLRMTFSKAVKKVYSDNLKRREIWEDNVKIRSLGRRV
jgi:hypothetical protein